MEAIYIQLILNRVQSINDKYENWYVGIAENAKERLKQHNAIETPNILIDLKNEDMARELEKYLINNYHFQGGPGGGSNKTASIYAYKITSKTIQ